MQGIPTHYKMNLGQPFAQNDKDYWKLISSCTTMLNLVLLPILGKTSRSWNLKFSTSKCTVQTLHLWISVWTSKGASWRSSICRWWWRGKGSSVWLPSHSAQIVLFWWHQKPCGLPDKVWWDARKPCGKAIHLQPSIQNSIVRGR